MAGFVEIFEVGPRDGLQNEPGLIDLAQKVALVDCLSRAGFRRIECASFVSPKWVPQMADSDALMTRITRSSGVLYAALTPNIKGLERAIEADIDEVAIFGAASEGFSKANINASRYEALERFRPLVALAKEADLPVRGYVSCVVECPYDGPVPPEEVARSVAGLRDLGCFEISLGETLGRARPEAVEEMLCAVLQELPPEQLAGHFHDTQGRALANVDVALDHGLRVFDAAIGGLGGCPYAPGAAGNLATQSLNEHLVSKGYETMLDPKILNEAARMAHSIRSKSPKKRPT